MIAVPEDRVVSDEWRFRARVVSAYDGDTFKVVMRLGMRQVCGEENDPIPVRLDGIDTPELTSKDPKVKAKALAAHTHIIDALQVFDPERRHILLYPKKASKLVFDKYGRLLCDVYYQKVTKTKVGKKTVEKIDWVHLNKELVDLGLAKPYKGGKRSWV